MLKKWWKWFKNLMLGLWEIVKIMGNWKGLLSLLIVWLLLSGSGLILLGFILAQKSLIALGTTIYTFWLLPLTPLMVINVFIALLVQRYIFFDKKVSKEYIKEKLKLLKEKEKEVR